MMADFNKDPVLYIKDQLRTKASLKQQIYSKLQQVFREIRTEAGNIITEISQYKNEMNPGVILEVVDSSDIEFHVHFGGDLMVFSLQTNIVTFPKNYYLMKSPTTTSNEDLKYFGQILIYNFMADSLKYNRLQDAGFLLARLILNVNGNFVVEGAHGLKYLFNQIEDSVIDQEKIRLILLKAMDVCIQSDLVAPPYQNIQFISLGEKLSRQKEAGWDNKIGFQMSYDQEDVQS